MLVFFVVFKTNVRIWHKKNANVHGMFKSRWLQDLPGQQEKVAKLTGAQLSLCASSYVLLSSLPEA